MWFNKKIKGIIEEKNEFKAYCNNGMNTALDNCLRNLQVRLNSERKMKNFKVLSAKKNFFNKIAGKFNDTHKNAKACWSFMKIFLNNKKILLIPPVVYITLIPSKQISKRLVFL